MKIQKDIKFLKIIIFINKMASYVDNLKINNLYYRNIDTKCKRIVSSENYKLKNINNLVDENNFKKSDYLVEPQRTMIPLDDQNNPYNYDNDEFWNKKYDYNNLVDKDGNKVYFTGVCNPLLLDSCENINEEDNVPMNGLCSTKNLNKNNFYFTLDKDMDLDNNYKLNDKNQFNITNSHKIKSGEKISDTILNKEDFAKKYCRTGQFEIINDEYFCL